MQLTVFENHRKGLIQHCDQSELRLQKFIENAKNGPFWRLFENQKLAVKQCYQKGHFCLRKCQKSTSDRDSNELKNLPPPFFWHKYGNLQMFPNPTQNPKMVMKNCTGLFHCARSSSSAGGLTSMVTVGTVGASFRRFVAVVRLFGFKFRRNSNILRSQCLSFIMTTSDLRSKVVAA